MTPIKRLESWIIRRGPKIRAEKVRVTRIMQDLKKQIQGLEREIKEIKNAPRKEHSPKGKRNKGLSGKRGFSVESKVPEKGSGVSGSAKKGQKRTDKPNRNE